MPLAPVPVPYPTGVHVTVRNLDGQLIAGSTGAVTVTEPLTPLVDPSDPTLTITEKSELTANQNGVFNKALATFADADPAHTTKAHYLGVGSVIDWGDGTTSALKRSHLKLSHIDSEGKHWKVKHRHKYETAGDKVATLTLKDDSGAITTIDLNIRMM